MKRQRIHRGTPSTADRLRFVLAALAASAATACSTSVRPPDAFVLEDFDQAGLDGVFLNETLVVHFGSDVDRVSITSESLRIVADDGRAAEGTFEVRGSKVLFHPRPPREADLSDCGLAASTRYSVLVAGFPYPDGVRDRRGRPLARTHSFTFTTVNPAEDEKLLSDASPALAEELRLVSPEIGPVDPVVLACDEPIDPRSLDSGQFVLFYDSPEPIALRAVLRENTREGAVIELRPVDEEGNLRALDEGRHQVWMDPKIWQDPVSARVAPLLDFGGHPVVPVWPRSPRAGYVEVRRADPLREFDRYVEEFLDPRRRSPAAVDDSDGIAAWRGGVATIHYPAAAGYGRDGENRLEGDDSRLDVQATELRVESGDVVRLSGEGLVVLRSQGRMVVDGRIERGEAPTSATPSTRVPDFDFLPAESLSAWLARARERGEEWTVLIAGGDLVLSGQLAIEGPVLLVAGGWIRDTREVRSGNAWVVSSSTPFRSGRRADLVLDEPKLNRLAEPRTWSVLSAPIQPPRGHSGWLPARVRASHGAGRYRVTYLGERQLPGGAVEVVGPVESPVLLEDCQALRLRVDLTMEPAHVSPTWDPPAVDAVEVAWETP